jgi:hypothetical protein
MTFNRDRDGASSPASSAGTVGPVYGVDPHTGQATRLASQPPLALENEVAWGGPNGIINAFGVEAGGTRHMYAFSRDSGRTWSTSVLPGGAEYHYLPFTNDGVHLYMFSMSLDDAGRHYYVSGDRGATWSQRTLPAGSFAFDRPGDAYVARDGAVVLVEHSWAAGAARFWVSRDNAATFGQLSSMHGLPSPFDGSVQQLHDDSYVARPFDASTSFYRSTDGWNWTKVTVR